LPKSKFAVRREAETFHTNIYAWLSAPLSEFTLWNSNSDLITSQVEMISHPVNDPLIDGVEIRRYFSTVTQRWYQFACYDYDSILLWNKGYERTVLAPFLSGLSGEYQTYGQVKSIISRAESPEFVISRWLTRPDRLVYAFSEISGIQQIQVKSFSYTKRDGFIAHTYDGEVFGYLFLTDPREPGYINQTRSTSKIQNKQ
jgi:hypothetical protein